MPACTAVPTADRHGAGAQAGGPPGEAVPRGASSSGGVPGQGDGPDGPGQGFPWPLWAHPGTGSEEGTAGPGARAGTVSRCSPGGGGAGGVRGRGAAAGAGGRGRGRWAQAGAGLRAGQYLVVQRELEAALQLLVEALLGAVGQLEGQLGAAGPQRAQQHGQHPHPGPHPGPHPTAPAALPARPA